MLRKIAAAVLAPFPAALFQAVVIALWPKPGGGLFEHPASMFVVMCLYFWFFGLLLGFPIWLIMGKRSGATLRTFVFVGVVVGSAPISIPLAILAARGQASAYLVAYNLLLFGLGGAAAGALYWSILVRKRVVEELKATFS